MERGSDSVIDSHIHLSYRYFDQTFPYIGMEDEQYVICEGDRHSLIAEMKKQGIDCCIEPAIDVDSNEFLLRLSRESNGFILPAVGNHPTRCIKRVEMSLHIVHFSLGLVDGIVPHGYFSGYEVLFCWKILIHTIFLVSKNKLKKCHANYIIIVTKIRSVVLWQVAYIQKLRRE